MKLVTGNTYTTCLVIQAVMARLAETYRDPAQQTLAVVGAGGDIGAACVELLTPRFRRTLLIGSGKLGTLSRLNSLARRHDAAEVSDLSGLPNADVVVYATNAVTAPFTTDVLKEHAIVCDVSIPTSFAPDVMKGRSDVHWLAGGQVRLPMEELISIPGFPLSLGHTYGCMAEAILLGFEDHDVPSLVGPIDADRVQMLQSLATIHGFAHSTVGWGIPANR